MAGHSTGKSAPPLFRMYICFGQDSKREPDRDVFFFFRLELALISSRNDHSFEDDLRLSDCIADAFLHKPDYAKRLWLVFECSLSAQCWLPRMGSHELSLREAIGIVAGDCQLSHQCLGSGLKQRRIPLGGGALLCTHEIMCAVTNHIIVSSKPMPSMRTKPALKSVLWCKLSMLYSWISRVDATPLGFHPYDSPQIMTPKEGNIGSILQFWISNRTSCLYIRTGFPSRVHAVY